MVHEMLSSLLINQKHTEFWILIKLQYNNSQSLEGTLEKVCKNWTKIETWKQRIVKRTELNRYTTNDLVNSSRSSI